MYNFINIFNVFAICFFAYNNLNGFRIQNVFPSKFQFYFKNVPNISKNSAEIFFFYGVFPFSSKKNCVYENAGKPYSHVLYKVKIDAITPKMRDGNDVRNGWMRPKLEKLTFKNNSIEFTNINFPETDLPNCCLESVRLQSTRRLIYEDGSLSRMLPKSEYDDTQFGEFALPSPRTRWIF